MLAVLVGWWLPVGTSGLRGVSRRSLLLLLGLLLVALLLAVAGLLALVTRLLLTICCWLGVVILVVTSRLAVSIVTLRCSGGSLLAITRVGRLCSISWLRAIRLGSSWSSSSRSAVITTGSIPLG